MQLFTRPTNFHRYMAWWLVVIFNTDNMSKYLVSSMPADVQTPLGARTSADTVMTNLQLHIYTGPALKHSTLETGSLFSKLSLFSKVLYNRCKILVWSIAMNILAALWILMIWCFRTRPSVATVLNMHPCVSSCLRVNIIKWKYLLSINYFPCC